MTSNLNPVVYAQWASKYVQQLVDTTYDLRGIIQQGFFTDTGGKTPFSPKADEIEIINEYFGKKMKPYGPKAKSKDIAYYHVQYFSALDARARELIYGPSRGLDRIDNNLLVHYLRANCDTSTIRDILNLNESPLITEIKAYLHELHQDDVEFEHNKEAGLGSMVKLTFPPLEVLKARRAGTVPERTGLSEDGFDLLHALDVLNEGEVK